MQADLGGPARVRLDIWLKLSRLIKRRTIAQAACDGGRVQLNQRQAKPASPVREGDRLRLDLGRRVTEVEVLQVPAGNVPASRAGELYRLLGGSLPSEPEADDATQEDEEKA